MSSSSPNLPPAAALPDLSTAEVSQAIGLLFEPCPTLVELVHPLARQPDQTWPELIAAVRRALLALDVRDPRVSAIVAAHPRLGAKKVESVQSQAEQASLQSSATEAAQLAELNAAYEKTFPGLRYVVFVNGRPRPEIMANMRERIAEADYAKEVERAFNAMCDIALDRASKLTARL